MGIHLPGAAVATLEWLGYRWPQADEDALAAAAQAWREFLGELERVADETNRAAQAVRSRNEGDSIDAFESAWREDHHHHQLGIEAVQLIAAMLDTGGNIVFLAKMAILAALTGRAVKTVPAVIAAVPSFGGSLALNAATSEAIRSAVGYAMDQLQERGQLLAAGPVRHDIESRLKRIEPKRTNTLESRSADDAPLGGRSGDGSRRPESHAAGVAWGGTEPSLLPDPNRKPRGVPADVPPITGAEPYATQRRYRSLQRENDSADALARYGFDVQQNPPARANGRTPDYLIEGEYFDHYAPVADDTDWIRDKISKKVASGQAERIVLSLEDAAVAPEGVREAIRNRPIEGLKEIILMKDGAPVRFFPFD